MPELIQAAELVGDPTAIPRQIRLLGHRQDVVRYWAAVGLYAARNELGAHVNAVRAGLHDESACVRIEVAAALVGACGDAEAAAVLAREIESEEQALSHQAIVKVLYMPEVAVDFAESVERVSSNDVDPSKYGFRRQQAVDMYMYLYRKAPLYYPADLRFIDIDSCVRQF